MTIKNQVDPILSASDELYRGLFEHMLEGLAYCKMIYEAGKPSDFIYLDVNRAFEQLTGLTGVCGKPVSEVIPGIRESNPELFEIYGRVATTGKPEKLETYVDGLGIWFAISVYSPKSEHFVAVFEDITERKQTEARINDLLLFNEKVLNTAPVGILTYKITGECIFANEEAARMVGTTLENLSAQNFRSLESWKRSGLYELAEKAIASEETVTADTHIITTFGKDKWLTVRAVTFKSKAETQLLITFSDITERRQVEEALAKEQYLLQALLDAAPDYIYFKDTESRFIRTSKAHAKAFGLSDPALVIGRSDFDFFTGEHARQAYEDEQEIIRTGQPISKEEKETWEDRPDTWALTTKMPLRDQEGNIIGTFGISKDISERKQTEEALRESEQRFHQLFATSPDAILLIDPHHPAISWPIVDCNEAACQMNGYTRDDLIGQSVDILNITKGTNEERGFYLDRLRREGVIHIETLHRHKNGHLFPVEVSTSLFALEGHELVLGIDRNITDRKQAEANQLSYTAFLESLNHITRIVLEAQDLESTLQVLVEKMATLFRADDCFLDLWDEVNEKPIPMVAYGSMKDNYSQLVFEAGEHTLAASLMEAGHPLVIADIRNSPYLSLRVASLFSSHTMLGLPLIVQDRKLAILYLGYTQNRTFHQNEIDQAEIAAQQIALVLTKRQLFEDAQRLLKQLTVLHEIAGVAIEVDTVDRLIEHATEIIGRSLFSDNFGILLMDEDKAVLHPHPSYRFTSNNNSLATDMPIGQGITGRVAETGQSIRIGNIESAQHYVDLDQSTSSELCVPIKLKDRVLGVINAESTRADAFSLDDELLLGTIAGELATTIERIRTVEAEHQWFNQLAHSNDLIYAIAQITTQIEKALTHDEIIQAVGSELRKLELSSTMATYDREHSKFTITYASMEPPILEQMENGLGFSLLESTFSLKKLNSILNNEDVLRPAAVANPENEIQVLFPRRRDEGITEILLGVGVGPETELLRLPLVFEENLLGILWVWGRGIIKSDLPILSIFAKQIGSSLERARLFQEVQSLALTDHLTGLQNRRSLFELGRIEFARSNRTYRPFSCLMLDIDHFKQINDNYGHPIGDQVLRQIAECAQRSIRDVDLIGRYGGEEFLIFLPETDLVTAQRVAERLRASIEKTPMKASEQELRVTVSIGISRKDENTLELETLIARADQALYVAKHKGRNQVASSK
jgi:diguanylate cyclase (GGDEF)-like protein/PAS domain S-box-containing protein